MNPPSPPPAVAAGAATVSVEYWLLSLWASTEKLAGLGLHLEPHPRRPSRLRLAHAVGTPGKEAAKRPDRNPVKNEGWHLRRLMRPIAHHAAGCP